MIAKLNRIHFGDTDEGAGRVACPAHFSVRLAFLSGDGHSRAKAACVKNLVIVSQRPNRVHFRSRRLSETLDYIIGTSPSDASSLLVNFKCARGTLRHHHCITVAQT